MTNKIILESLKLKGFQNPSAIAEIISFVPNPTVALEMLLGIYEPHPLDYANRFRKSKYSSSNSLYEITGIHELGNLVTYKKYEQKTQTVYYLTKEDAEKNIYQLERPKYGVDYHSSKSLPVNGYVESEQSTDFNDFQSSYANVIDTEKAFRILEDWDNFGMDLADPTDNMYAMQG